jgi:hypothetical protein
VKLRLSGKGNPFSSKDGGGGDVSTCCEWWGTVGARGRERERRRQGRAGAAAPVEDVNGFRAEM